MSKKDDDAPRSFTRFFEWLADGEAAAAAAKDLQELGKRLIDESSAQNKMVSGSLTVQVKITRDPRGHCGLTYSVTRKDPTPQRNGSVLWQTKSGNFTPENPKQMNLELRDVSARKPAQDVAFDPETGEVLEA